MPALCRVEPRHHRDMLKCPGKSDGISFYTLPNTTYRYFWDSTHSRKCPDYKDA